MEKLRWFMRAGGAPWLRWSIRLLLAAGVVFVCLLPYQYEIGGECRVVPSAQFSVRAQLSDEIEEIYVNDGDAVRQGDALVTLIGREEQAAVKVTEAELKRAEADLALLKAGSRDEDIQIAEQKVELCQVQLRYRETELNRIKQLHSDNVASETELDQALKARDISQSMLLAAQENHTRIKAGARAEQVLAAEARVEALAAKLEHARNMQELCRIEAPSDGIVSTPHVQGKRGHVVQPGDLIAVVQDTSKMWLEIAADQAAASAIQPDMPVKVRLHGTYGQLLEGRVDRISWYTEDKVDVKSDSFRTDRETMVDRVQSRDDQQYIRVYVDLEDEETELLPGMTGYAKVVVKADIVGNALLRPVLRFFRVDVWSWLP